MVAANGTQASPHRNGTVSHPAPEVSAPPPSRPPLEPVSDGGAPSDGHDARGRFTAGNRCARGNPTARRMAQLRQALLDDATPEKVRALGDKLYAQALAGDVAAARVWLAYVVGKATAAPDPDRLDLDEWRLLDAWPAKAEALRALLDACPPDVVTEAMRALSPAEQTAALAGLFEQLAQDTNLKQAVLKGRGQRTGGKPLC